MTTPSFPKLLALLVAFLAPLGGPAFACVCADGSSSVQAASPFCDGVPTENESAPDQSCEEGCASTHLVAPTGSGQESVDALDAVPALVALLAHPVAVQASVPCRRPPPVEAPVPSRAGCLRGVILIV